MFYARFYVLKTINPLLNNLPQENKNNSITPLTDNDGKIKIIKVAAIVYASKSTRFQKHRETTKPNELNLKLLKSYFLFTAFIQF